MANEMRDKLFELLTDCEIEYAQYLSEECDKAIKGDVTKQLFKRLEFYADRLIENGVIVPPCKVGDTLYTVGIYTGQIVELPIYAVTVYSDDTIFIMGNTSYVSVKEHIGKTVFLTKSEAEQKLKEMRGENG